VEDRRTTVIEVAGEIVDQRRVRGIIDELAGDAVDEVSVLPLAACGMAGANGPDGCARAVR
jgi:ribosomal protein L12E/L44/L45/RPP1/RPP2